MVVGWAAGTPFSFLPYRNGIDPSVKIILITRNIFSKL